MKKYTLERFEKEDKVLGKVLEWTLLILLSIVVIRYVWVYVLAF